MSVGEIEKILAFLGIIFFIIILTGCVPNKGTVEHKKSDTLIYSCIDEVLYIKNYVVNGHYVYTPKYTKDGSIEICETLPRYKFDQ